MPPTHVTVSNESGIEVDEDSLVDLVGYLLPELGLHPACVLGITLVTPEPMTALHVEWMDEPGPTDVLSFPIDEVRPPAPGEEPEPGILGDIVLCPAYLPPQMEQSGRTLDEEIQFLTTHGVLHLIGHDHQEPDDYARMFALQDTLLAGWRAR